MMRANAGGDDDDDGSDDDHFDDHFDDDDDAEREPREYVSPREVLERADAATRAADAFVTTRADGAFPESSEDANVAGTRPSPEAMAKLDKELHRIVDGLKTSPQDDAKRQGLMSKFKSMISTRFEGVRVAPFGSYVSAFHSAGSDIDISLQIDKDGPWYDEREEAQAKRSQRGGVRARRQQRQGKSKRAQLLRKVASELRYRNYRDVQLISKARVPLIKFKDPQTGVACDVCIENDGVYKSAVLGLVADLDQRYRDLVFLIKLWAKHYDVNNAMEGSFNSYSLCLLVMHHLQRRKIPILPPTMLLTLPRPDLVESETRELAEHVANTDEQFDTWKVSKARVVSDASRDIAAVKYRAERYIGYGRENKDTLAELFVSFFAQLRAVKDLFKNGLNASTYHGRFIVHSSWQAFKYPLGVEDPFAAGDNVARAVQSRTRDYVLNAFPAACAELSKMLHAQDNVQFMRSLLSLLGEKAVPPDVLARLRPPLPVIPPGLRPPPPGMQPPPPGSANALMELLAQQVPPPGASAEDLLVMLTKQRQQQAEAAQRAALNEQQMLQHQQDVMRAQQAQRLAQSQQLQDPHRTPIHVTSLFQGGAPQHPQHLHAAPPRANMVVPPGFGAPPAAQPPPRPTPLPTPSFSGGLGGGIFSSIASGGGGLFGTSPAPPPNGAVVDEISQHFATNMSIMSEFGSAQTPGRFPTDFPPSGAMTPNGAGATPIPHHASSSSTAATTTTTTTMAPPPHRRLVPGPVDPPAPAPLQRARSGVAIPKPRPRQ